MALWGGRFDGTVDEVTQRFGASLMVDKEMAEQDILASLAHAKMLAKQEIISQPDFLVIERGLHEILSEIKAGTFVFDVNDEDIHMAVEGALIKRIGEAGKRLHTGRSRNDQVATDLRIYTKDMLQEMYQAALALQQALIKTAKANQELILPGFTHLQHAQPVLLAHHLLAYFWMLARDVKRIAQAYESADSLPLGAAALAGTSYPLDRFYTASELGLVRYAQIAWMR